MIARAARGITGGEGIAYADVAVVDHTGKFIFYDWKSGSAYTLTEEENVHQIFSELVAGLAQAAAN